MSQITEQLNIAEKVNAFLETHKDDYDEREYEFLKRNWKFALSKGFHMDIIRQMFAELGLLTEKNDIYQGFMKILEENFDIDRDIIEVGGGHIPSLAKRIALKQKKGTITVYDPRLLTTESEYPNMILKKECFTRDTPVSSDQLVIGFMPCDATEKLLSSAVKNNADFLVALCEGGPHGDEFDYFESDDEWITSMIATARQTKKGPLQITNLKQYEDPYPVIYTKKR